jgi:excisionase family DNA binding protein
VNKHWNDTRRVAATAQSLASAPALTVFDVATRLKVSDKTVRRLIKAGALKSVRVGHCVRVAEADFHAYIASDQ